MFSLGVSGYHTSEDTATGAHTYAAATGDRVTRTLGACEGIEVRSVKNSEVPTFDPVLLRL
jgi:hypothetical protein